MCFKFLYLTIIYNTDIDIVSSMQNKIKESKKDVVQYININKTKSDHG
jgi:hypothetical protein